VKNSENSISISIDFVGFPTKPLEFLHDTFELRNTLKVTYFSVEFFLDSTELERVS
jgi:hypothetical protein